MNIEEAKTKWCPDSRIAVSTASFSDGEHIATTINRKGVLDKGEIVFHDACLCIANRCMAWRWNFETVDGDVLSSVKDGYCGKFGEE